MGGSEIDYDNTYGLGFPVIQCLVRERACIETCRPRGASDQGLKKGRPSQQSANEASDADDDTVHCH